MFLMEIPFESFVSTEVPAFLFAEYVSQLQEDR